MFEIRVKHKKKLFSEKPKKLFKYLLQGAFYPSIFLCFFTRPVEKSLTNIKSKHNLFPQKNINSNFQWWCEQQHIESSLFVCGNIINCLA